MTHSSSPRNPLAQGWSRWNRKLHAYLGLYLLFFLWLFSLSGLLLNHPTWKFAEFWPSRRQSTQERSVTAPPVGSDLQQARDLCRQLDLTGEIEWTASRAEADRLDFRVARPGHTFEVKADFQRGRATVQRTDLNAWGVLHVLHVFTGVRLGDARNSRDWLLTSVWAFAMDALAVGLIFLVVSSLFLWHEDPARRRPGAIALALGCLICGLFCFGLRWLL